MKQIFIVLVLFVLFFTAFPVQGSSLGNETDSQQSHFQVIPDEAIRLRILANSDSDSDQQLKRMIRDRVNAEINSWVEEIDNIERARELIQNNLKQIEDIVAQVLEEEGVDQTYQVDYDSNISFPTKVYDTYIYPAGNYEAILITLGEGQGANWWCVLFPPLCFLDFSNGTSVVEEETHDEEDDQDTVSQLDKETEDETEDVQVNFFFLKWFS